MMQTNPLIDKQVEKRKALAKVYKILIQLAEEFENDTAGADSSGTANKRLDEPKSTDTEPLS